MRVLTTTALCLIPVAGFADERLERFEDISERFTNVMLSLMVEDAIKEGADPSLRDTALPVFKWNAALREAGGCMIDRYVTELGDTGTDGFLDDMEAIFQGIEDADDLDSIEGISEGFALGGLTDAQNAEIMRDCGMISAQSAWMNESGFFQMMIDANP